MRSSAIAVAVVLLAIPVHADARGGSFGVSSAGPMQTQAVPRGALDERAQALLRRADMLQRDKNYAGAFAAYMEAVRIDPRAADLHLIDNYGNRYDAPLPPSASAADRKLEEQRNKEDAAGREAALRQYLQLRPGDLAATERLASVVNLTEAESLFAPFFNARPSDLDLYATRATVRAKRGYWAGALDDEVRASELDPDNAERHYAVGVVAYEGVVKGNLTVDEKRDFIRRALEQLVRAETLRKNYFEAMAYHSLLLRQQALLEDDPAVEKTLIAEADAIRQKALEIIKAQRAQSAGDQVAASPSEAPTAAPESPEGPFRVAGDVRAPILIERVEPVYPEEARKHGVSGIVILEIVVDATGQVTRATVLKPIADGGSEAALAAVKQWKFKPGTLNGQPIDVIYNVTVRIAP